MRDSWDYIEARLAEQRTAAEQRRRIAQARSRAGSTPRLGSLFRTRSRSHDELSGCKQ